MATRTYLRWLRAFINTTASIPLLVVLVLLLVPSGRLGCDPAALAAEGGQQKTDSCDTFALPLDNMQDVAFTLQRIRQQNINIYIEATRKKPRRFELNTPSLTSVPDTPLEPESAYLPLRKPWLVYFVGTMEPLIQILTEQLSHLDDKAEQADVPKDKLAQWQGIVKEWKGAIKQLNGQLDQGACLVDDSNPDNIAVAKTARAIDQQLEVLDGILLKASAFLENVIPAKG